MRETTAVFPGRAICERYEGSGYWAKSSAPLERKETGTFPPSSGNGADCCSLVQALHRPQAQRAAKLRFSAAASGAQRVLKGVPDPKGNAARQRRIRPVHALPIAHTGPKEMVCL